MRFSEALKVLKPDFRLVLSPAFELEATGEAAPEFDAAIFTSTVGVDYAPYGAGRQAWCVGDATAQAAQGTGYHAISAAGSAEDLVALILQESPTGKLAHFRGEVSQGDITIRLQGAGFQCVDCVAYRKAPSDPTGELSDCLAGQTPIILPVFSGETVSILADWPFDFSNCHVVAISPAVAEHAALLSPASVRHSTHPDQAAMAQEVACLIA